MLGLAMILSFSLLTACGSNEEAAPEVTEETPANEVVENEAVEEVTVNEGETETTESKEVSE